MKKNITLETVNMDKRDKLTFKELFEAVIEEKEHYEKLGMLDELMEQEVVFDINDAHGNLLTADAYMLVGFLEGGKVVLSGNLSSIYEENTGN